ncbi:Flp family type IVb pilin [Myxococcota bacterium]|nr:Flp family type IVb pilin [Myxococcota bacterium]
MQSNKPRKNILKRQRGQGMTEYIIIVALIAIGTIFVVTVFGDNLRALFGNATNALSGESSSFEGEQVEEDDIKRNLKDFSDFDE